MLTLKSQNKKVRYEKLFYEKHNFFKVHAAKNYLLNYNSVTYFYMHANPFQQMEIDFFNGGNNGETHIFV